MSLPAPLYVLGVGDTLPRQDIVLEKLFYNKVTYQGTRMSIEAIISHYGYSGTKVRIQLRGNRQKYSQELLLPTSGLATARFVLPTAEVGNYRYKVEIAPLKGELTSSNNRKDAFVEVLKEKLQLLILAPYPTS